MKIHHDIFELGGYRPTGETIAANWMESDGLVVLCSEDGEPLLSDFGNPVSEKVPSGTAPRIVAARLATRHHKADDSPFNRRIDPHEYGKVPC
ncbi:MAG TPA: hypothetical protein VKR55_21110 [Bradyrhizobium sp.]|uniref:hypothetical protein n=1 Tax=Bradyrhizobium sp. TaxID=376 RepID=UPI002CF50E36|nr:hypothetical protein [Bradyrhizobium sp.]HLZ04632.1 hypothetical protein [Bradyrhizobium sp.]